MGDYLERLAAKGHSQEVMRNRTKHPEGIGAARGRGGLKIVNGVGGGIDWRTEIFLQNGASYSPAESFFPSRKGDMARRYFEELGGALGGFRPCPSSLASPSPCNL